MLPCNGAFSAAHAPLLQVGAATDQVPSARHEAEVVVLGVSSYPVLQEKVATSRYLNPLVDGETVPWVMPRSSHGTPMHSGVDPAHVWSTLHVSCVSLASTNWYPVLHVYVAVLGYTCLFDVETTALSTVGGSLHAMPMHSPEFDPPQLVRVNPAGQPSHTLQGLLPSVVLYLPAGHASHVPSVK